MAKTMVTIEKTLQPLLMRRSVSPKRLQAPAPSPDELEGMLQAAMRAPDHARLLPWRVIEFRSETRELLAHCFEQEKLRRDPMTSASDLRRAREHANRPPMLLGFVISPHDLSTVPMREQWLSAGAALGNLLNAAHQLGYGAGILSGERCFDRMLTGQLGINDREYLAGFISIGTIQEAPPPQKERLTQSVLSCWPGHPIGESLIGCGPVKNHADRSPTKASSNFRLSDAVVAQK